MAQKEHSYQELWIDLCISLKKSERNDLPDRFDTILEILNNLTDSDLISGFNTVKTPASVRVSKTKRLTSANKEKGRENEFNTYQRWANRNDLSLEPFFIRKSQSTYEEIQFPEIYLVVKDAPDRLYTAPAAPYPDRDGLATVRGVFPCADSKRKYEITDYLNAVKNGENWKNRSINRCQPQITEHTVVLSPMFTKTLTVFWVKSGCFYRMNIQLAKYPLMMSVALILHLNIRVMKDIY
jgi:hypothetical protein